MQGLRNLPAGTAVTLAAAAPALAGGQTTRIPAGPLTAYAERNAAAIVRQVRAGARCALRPPSQTADVAEGLDSTDPPTGGIVYLWAVRLRARGYALDMTEGAWPAFQHDLYRRLIAPHGGGAPYVTGAWGLPQLTGGPVPRAQHAWRVWADTTQALYGSRQAHLADLLAAARQAWGLAGRGGPADESDAQTMARLQRAHTEAAGDADLFALFALALAPEYAPQRCRRTEALGRWVAAFLPELALIVAYGDARVWWVPGREVETTGSSCAVAEDGRMCVLLPQPRVLRLADPTNLHARSPWVWAEEPRAPAQAEIHGGTSDGSEDGSEAGSEAGSDSEAGDDSDSDSDSDGGWDGDEADAWRAQKMRLLRE